MADIVKKVVEFSRNDEEIRVLEKDLLQRYMYRVTHKDPDALF